MEWGGLVPPLLFRPFFVTRANLLIFFWGGGRGRHGPLPGLFFFCLSRASVASCERAHSKVKISHNYLRFSASSDRLEDLVQISSERGIADTIELKTLVDVFKLKNQRKTKEKPKESFTHFRFHFHILPVPLFLIFSEFFNFVFILYCDTVIISLHHMLP